MDRTAPPADAGIACIAFTNTAHNFGAADIDDDISSYGDLVQWARAAGIIDREQMRQLTARAKQSPRSAEAALATARELRESLYRILGARFGGTKPPAEDLQRLNAELRAAMSGAELNVSGAKFAWRLADGKGLAEPVLWPIVRSAAEMLTSENGPRIVECGGRACTWLVVDTTKNHSRKYCSAQGCGNRTRVRRFYDRQRAGY